MYKVELLSRIEKLSDIVHGKDIMKFEFSQDTLLEMHKVLNDLTEEYINLYCDN